jgi:hypothetical protein
MGILQCIMQLIRTIVPGVPLAHDGLESRVRLDHFLIFGCSSLSRLSTENTRYSE